jgi:hypothetical protein
MMHAVYLQNQGNTMTYGGSLSIENYTKSKFKLALFLLTRRHDAEKRYFPNCPSTQWLALVLDLHF